MLDFLDNQFIWKTSKYLIFDDLYGFSVLKSIGFHSKIINIGSF